MGYTYVCFCAPVIELRVQPFYVKKIHQSPDCLQMSSYPTFSPEEELEVIDGNIVALDLYNLRYFARWGKTP